MPRDGATDRRYFPASHGAPPRFCGRWGCALPQFQRRRRFSMKWKMVLGALVVSAGLCTQSYGFELLDRMLGIHHHSSGCNSCCEPACCEPACCEPTCCEANACCEPACCEKSACCGNGCGNDCCEPSCCEADACCDSCCDTGCCKKRCCLLDRLFACKKRCCKSSCCDDCCDDCCNGGCDSCNGGAAEEHAPAAAEEDGPPEGPGEDTSASIQTKRQIVKAHSTGSVVRRHYR